MSIRVKSCTCLSLRTGLLIWGYLALMIIYMSILYILWQIHVIFNAKVEFNPDQLIFKILGLLAIVMYFLFHVILVAGLHKESSGLLGVYRGFLLISMILEGIAAAFYVPLSLYNIYNEEIDASNGVYYVHDLYIQLLRFMFYAVVIVAAVFFLNVYVLVCVRSMISILDGDDDDDYLRQPPENPEVITHNNRNYKIDKDDSDY